MPYSGPGDSNLPENVKKMSEGDRAQWVEVFNSSHAKCISDGGDSKTCEGSAFAQANGVVKGEKRMDIKELWEGIRGLFAPPLEERATYPWDKCIADQMKKYGSKDKAEKICGAIKAKYGRSDTNDMFLPAGFDLEREIAEIEASFRSVEAFNLPTQTRSLVVTRDASGKPRWLMIAASAVINKVGAIDSTALFDSFIRKAPEVGYPVLDFLHEQNKVRFGVADWLHRDGALYIASGTFDDTDMGRAAAAGLESQSDYWGASIAYRITSPPLVMQAEGEIPVYTDGVNDFISIVPKRMAANLFTATSVAKEVNRMDKTAYDELVRLVGEERAKQFAGEVDDANRTITETGMVTRTEPPPVETTVTTTAGDAATVTVMATEGTSESATRRDHVTPEEKARQDAPPAEPAKPATPTLEELAARVDELAAKVAEIEQGYGMMQQDSTRTKTQVDEITTRLAGVEASKARWDDWLNDAPENVRREADKIYRARNQEPAPMTMAQLAAQNVEKLKHEPHQRHA